MYTLFHPLPYLYTRVQFISTPSSSCDRNELIPPFVLQRDGHAVAAARRRRDL